MIPALFRPNAGHDWTEVDVLARHASGGYVCRETVRETGRALLGVLLAEPEQVRLVVGEIATEAA